MQKNYQKSICHVSIGTNDLVKAKAFYQPLLKTLAIDLVSQYDHALAFGKGYPEFWVQIPYDKGVSGTANGSHFAFVANSKQQVEDFYQQALLLGAYCEGAPGPRKDYGVPYYGCFVRDLDGHKIEASYWDFSHTDEKPAVQ